MCRPNDLTCSVQYYVFVLYYADMYVIPSHCCSRLSVKFRLIKWKFKTVFNMLLNMLNYKRKQVWYFYCRWCNIIFAFGNCLFIFKCQVKKWKYSETFNSPHSTNTKWSTADIRRDDEGSWDAVLSLCQLLNLHHAQHWSLTLIVSCQAHNIDTYIHPNITYSEIAQHFNTSSANQIYI